MPIRARSSLDIRLEKSGLVPADLLGSGPEDVLGLSSMMGGGIVVIFFDGGGGGRGRSR